MNENIFQSHYEPSGKETWYSLAVSLVENSNNQLPYLDRYIKRLNLVFVNSIRVKEFIRKSQIYSKIRSDDQYYFVDASKRYRPDLISQEVYGTPILYWVILSCNNLKNPLELKTGLTLRIPQLSTILNGGMV